jgi:two-component system LytT family sensor kinase
MPMVDAPRLDWRIATTCAVVLTFLFAIQQWAAGANSPSFAVSIERQGVIWGMWLLLLPLVAATARRYPIVRAKRNRWLLQQIGIATVFAVVHSFAVSALRHLLGINLVDSILEGALNLIVSQPGRNYLAYAFIMAAYQAVAYHREVRERDLRAARLEVDLAESKLANLEGRLRPHFLFNTLNSIAALIREDPVAAEAMLGQLSDLLRASLKADPGREVRLDEELQLVEQYLSIQRARFQDRLTISVDVGEDARRGYVPHLILQPLVENAVRHGIAPRESGGAVWVYAEHTGDRLRITVEDDGVGMGSSPPSLAGTGLGLSSVRSRLTHLYGEDQRIEVVTRRPSGTRVSIDIPFRADEVDVVLPVA